MRRGADANVAGGPMAGLMLRIGVLMAAVVGLVSPVLAGEKEKLSFYDCPKLRNFYTDECPVKKEEEKQEAKEEAAKKPKGKEEKKEALPPAEAPKPEPQAKSDLPDPKETYPFIVQPGTPPQMQDLLIAVAKGDIAAARKAAREVIRWQQEALNKVNLATQFLHEAAVETGYAARPDARIPVQSISDRQDVVVPYDVDRPTLFYFYNPACGVCRKTTPEVAKIRPDLREEMRIMAVVARPEDVAQASGLPFRVEVRPELFMAVAVDRTPTFVFVDPVTKKAARWTGYTRTAELESWIETVLRERKKPRENMRAGGDERPMPAGHPVRRRDDGGVTPASVAGGGR